MEITSPAANGADTALPRRRTIQQRLPRVRVSTALLKLIASGVLTLGQVPAGRGQVVAQVEVAGVVQFGGGWFQIVHDAGFLDHDGPEFAVSEMCWDFLHGVFPFMLFPASRSAM